MKTPRWRPELAAEITAHLRLSLRLQHLAPQVAGLLQDLHHYVAAEPRMAAYAFQILREASEAAPYHRERPAGYQPTRQHVGRQWLAADAYALEALEARWQSLPVPAVTAAVWVVRTYLRIHARRHGAVSSPHAAGFLTGHQAAVDAMAHTFRGSQPAERRYVRPWRRYA